ncbi:thioredoxin family protein [bacterium]|nr:thioredoxin family protein [bacterium]
MVRKLVAVLALVICIATLTAVAAADPIDDAVQQARANGKNVLIDFWAGWCPWCIKMDQTFQDYRIANVVRNGFIYVKLDCGAGDRFQDRQRQVGLTGYPLLVIVDPNCMVLGKQDGYSPAEQLLPFLQRYARGPDLPPMPPDPQPAPTGLAGTWLSGDGDTWIFSLNRFELRLPNRLPILGTVNQVAFNQYNLTSGDGASLTIVINSQTTNVINITMVSQGGERHTTELRRQDFGPGPMPTPQPQPQPQPQPEPTGDWNYLTELYPSRQETFWNSWIPPQGVNFEGSPQAHSYYGTAGADNYGTFSLARLTCPRPASVLDVTLGMADETSPDVTFLFQVIVDSAPPIERRVMLRSHQRLQLDIRGKGRLEFRTKQLTGQFNWNNKPLLVEPKVYY